MISKLKENWKTILVSVVTFVVVLLLCCLSDNEEVPVDPSSVKDVHEMTDEEIKEEVF